MNQDAPEDNWTKWACAAFDQARLNDDNTDCLAIIAAGHMAGALIADAYNKGDRGRVVTYKHIWEGKKDLSEKEIWITWTILYTQAREKNDKLDSLGEIETYVLKTYHEYACINSTLFINPSLEAYRDRIEIAFKGIVQDHSGLMSDLNWSIDSSRPARSKTASFNIYVTDIQTGGDRLGLKVSVDLFHTQHLPCLHRFGEEEWKSAPYQMIFTVKKA